MAGALAPVDPAIRCLVAAVALGRASSNEADAIILIGGVGIGPRDYTCEAVDDMADRRMEGFGEMYRRFLLEETDHGPGAVLVRAAAGVCNGSVLLAIPPPDGDDHPTGDDRARHAPIARGGRYRRGRRPPPHPFGPVKRTPRRIRLSASL
jgi:molybdenum cofactor biosynthesis protein B